MREEFDVVISFKAFLDVYDGGDEALFNHDLDVLHMQLTDLVDSLLKIEFGACSLAVEDLHFLPVGKEFKDRHSRQTLQEKREAFLALKYPELAHDSAIHHPEESVYFKTMTPKSPHEVAIGYLSYITRFAHLFNEKLERLAEALQQDADLIAIGQKHMPHRPEQSQTAEILAQTRELLDPRHLPAILLHANAALNRLRATPVSPSFYQTPASGARSLANDTGSGA